MFLLTLYCIIILHLNKSSSADRHLLSLWLVVVAAAAAFFSFVCLFSLFLFVCCFVVVVCFVFKSMCPCVLRTN